jgi:hypothetical protein
MKWRPAHPYQDVFLSLAMKRLAFALLDSMQAFTTLPLSTRAAAAAALPCCEREGRSEAVPVFV